MTALKGVIRIEHPHFVFLSETKVKGKEWEDIKSMLKFRNFICVDCSEDGRQRSGGLAMLWHEEIDLTLNSSSLNHMDFVVPNADGWKWRITGVYVL